MPTSAGPGRVPACECRRTLRKIGPTTSCRRTQLRPCDALTFSNLDDEGCDPQPHDHENDVGDSELRNVKGQPRPNKNQQSRQGIAHAPEETLDSRLGFVFSVAARVQE